MTKKEINKRIVEETRSRIKELGLKGKIDIFPAENTWVRRPRYWDDNGIGMFKVLLWDLNPLKGQELSDAINARIADARRHFGV